MMSCDRPPLNDPRWGRGCGAGRLARLLARSRLVGDDVGRVRLAAVLHNEDRRWHFVVREGVVLGKLLARKPAMGTKNDRWGRGGQLTNACVIRVTLDFCFFAGGGSLQRHHLHSRLALCGPAHRDLYHEQLLLAGGVLGCVCRGATATAGKARASEPNGAPGWTGGARAMIKEAVPEPTRAS